jgi:hypothetical protein
MPGPIAGLGVLDQKRELLHPQNITKQVVKALLCKIPKWSPFKAG